MPAVLLWDFGDTLVDERWMRRSPMEHPEWEQVWVEVMTRRADDWNVGRVSEHEIFAEIGAATAMSVEAIELHAQACCEQIVRHPMAWQIACEHRMPQAIVTVNPDLFVTRVMPQFDFATMFDAVVVSCEERTDDKVRLCEIALDRLGFAGPRADALLIDNREDLVEAWRATGGSAHCFRGDETFAADAPALLR